MKHVQTEPILGHDVVGGSARDCVESIAAWVAGGDRLRWLACLNPHSYTVALDRADFAEALRDADWLIPDGVGIVLASRYRGGAIRERITGFDVFIGLNRTLDSRGRGRVFFIGSTEATLAAIRARMAADFPNVEVAGTFSPPFKPRYSEAELGEMVTAINATRPDVLWVGMTAPKQELWIHALRDRLDVRFAAAIGAVFDFYTGRIVRSSPVFQRLGLEWLPRLIQEPRRLWRRMFVSAPVFVWHVVRAGRHRRGGP